MKFNFPLYWMPRYRKQLNTIESLLTYSGDGLKELLGRVISELKLFQQQQKAFETLTEKIKQQDSYILELEKDLQLKNKELQLKNEELLRRSQRTDDVDESKALLAAQKKQVAWADKMMEILDYTDYASVNEVLTREHILEGVQQRAEELINGMEIYSMNETGGEYDYNLQQIVATRETENADLHNKVYASLKRGFKVNGKCIREQEVIIYKLKS